MLRERCVCVCGLNRIRFPLHHPNRILARASVLCIPRPRNAFLFPRADSLTCPIEGSLVLAPFSLT